MPYESSQDKPGNREALRPSGAAAASCLLALLPFEGVSSEKQANPRTVPPRSFSPDPAGLPLPVPLAVLSSSALLGSLLSSDTGSPVADKTRGVLTLLMSPP